MERKVNLIESIDFFTVGLYLILVLLGWLNIYAAVYDDDHQSIFDLSQRYGKQLLWIVIALFIAVLIFIIDSKIYSAFSYIAYGGVILLLLLVLMFSRKIHGAQSWFEIGSIRFQPAEFGKIATSLAVAKFVSSFNFKMGNWKNIAIAFAIILLPVVLVVLQNDTGSALVYVAFLLVLYREGLSGLVLLLGIYLAILFITSMFFYPQFIFIALIILAGIAYFIYRKKIMEIVAASLLFISVFVVLCIGNHYFLSVSMDKLLAFAFFAVSLVYFYWAYKARIAFVYYLVAIVLSSMFFTISVDYIFYDILEKHQQTRINVLLGKELDLKGAGYNVHQSKIAIGSGGVTGKGFLQGTQTKYNFVPEQSTDFIFCTVGEEWGFMGSSVIIVLFAILLVRIVFLAERQRSSFSRIYGYGVAAVLLFHITINVGMTIGLAPVIGIPLPFFSYGGSSLWSFTILLFIFLRLDASRSELF